MSSRRSWTSSVRKWIRKQINLFRGSNPNQQGPRIQIEVPLTNLDTHYKMDHPERGLVIVFNHERFDNEKKYPRRNGTDKDVEKIKKTFTSLGFQVHSYKDMTLAEIQDQIEKYLEQNHYHKQRDCLVVFVLSHGKENDWLVARDKKYNAAEVLWNKFTSENCPSYAGKPKLFFLQPCRGGAVDRGVHFIPPAESKNGLKDYCKDGPKTDYDGEKKSIGFYAYPNMADILIYCSTFDGHVSYRHPTTGSLWITILCDELEKNWQTVEIQQILVGVNRRIAVELPSPTLDPALQNYKQIPLIRNSLTRLLIFGGKKDDSQLT